MLENCTCRIKALVKIRLVNLKYKDDLHSLLLLNLLSDSWETLAISLNNYVSKLTIDIVKENLLKGEASSFEAYVREK